MTLLTRIMTRITAEGYFAFKILKAENVVTRRFHSKVISSGQESTTKKSSNYMCI